MSDSTTPVHPYLKSNSCLILDANLITVLMVGQLGIGEVEKFKRTQDYTTKDANLIAKIIEQTASILVTPHILTEANNMLDWLKGEKRILALKLLADFVANCDEITKPSIEIMESNIYFKIGLSDTLLYELNHKKDTVLISSDFELCLLAAHKKCKAINFNTLRFHL